MSLLQQLAYLVFESNKREEWKKFAGEVIGFLFVIARSKSR